MSTPFGNVSQLVGPMSQFLGQGEMEIQAHRQTDRQTGRQTDRQIETEREGKGRQTDRKPNAY